MYFDSTTSYTLSSKFVGTLDEDLNSLGSEKISSRVSALIFSQQPRLLQSPDEIWGPEFSKGSLKVVSFLDGSYESRGVGIKSLLEVTAAKLVLLVQKLLLLVLKVNAAGIQFTTAERLQLLKG
ncbi:hypothetical protein Tco_1106463 [Tanacetum coccineum]